MILSLRVCLMYSSVTFVLVPMGTSGMPSLSRAFMHPLYSSRLACAPRTASRARPPFARLPSPPFCICPELCVLLPERRKFGSLRDVRSP